MKEQIFCGGVILPEHMRPTEESNAKRKRDWDAAVKKADDYWRKNDPEFIKMVENW